MRTAYQAGMTTAEIERSCFRLVRLRIEAHAESLRTQMRLAAWPVATMINLWSKSKVSVEELLGEESGRERFESKAELLASMRREDE